MTAWTPDHESTRGAWQAVVDNLIDRAARELWGSRTIAVSIASTAGLDYKRADDLIRSAIKHGYLEERPYPGGMHKGHNKRQTQVRLTPCRVCGCLDNPNDDDCYRVEPNLCSRCA